MASETFIILPTQISDADAVRACGDRSFGSDSFRDHIFPPSLQHLTTPEAKIQWRAGRFRMQLESGDLIHFKCVLENDHSKIVGYSAWYRPGHFAKGKTLAEGLLGKSDAESKTEPQSDLTAQAGPDGAKPPAPVAGAEKKGEENFPPFMDGEAYLAVTAKMDEERKKIWGDEADYWYLGGLAVDPAYQKRGLARRLIDMVLEWADADGVPTYLESTPAGAAVYPRFGFKKVGEYGFFHGQHVSEFHIRQPGATTPSKQGFPRP